MHTPLIPVIAIPFIYCISVPIISIIKWIHTYISFQCNLAFITNFFIRYTYIKPVAGKKTRKKIKSVFSLTNNLPGIGPIKKKFLENSCVGVSISGLGKKAWLTGFVNNALKFAHILFCNRISFYIHSIYHCLISGCALELKL